MNPIWTRRSFLAGAAKAAGVGAFAAAGIDLPAGAAAAAAAEGAAPFKTTLRKALIMGKINAQECEAWKKAGFEGIETSASSVTPEEAQAGRKIAEAAGLKIHCVLRGWTNVNQPKGFDGDVASVVTALNAAAGYGADAVLWVPCRTGGPKGPAMPKAWEYAYDFDPRTCRVTAVAKGDNAPYADYIKAQNDATDAARKAVEQLIPAAEKAGVILALENVWNNLWCMPDFFAAFAKSFDNKWVAVYFDIGNHVKYAPAEQWIAALGKLLVKAHVKDFKLNPDGHDGKFVDIRDGSVNWPAVRRELDKIGYNGWMTIEGSGTLSLEERNKRLDLIIAGK